ncbi:MAG: hypothetical protein HYY24_09890 [Verrucomicrobia bacterium]|nr:hypothetical protein [Verrucomicrobiota bacterium]
MALPRVYNWDKTLRGLKEFDALLPGVLPNLVLVGGGACWFYREALRQAADTDFRVPPATPEQEAVWLSKDIDFMGVTPEEAAEILRVPLNADTHTIQFHGLEIDFVDAGLHLTQDNCLLHARSVKTPEVSFSVVDASPLYSEKCALVLVKDRPQDRLHRELLEQFLNYDFCHSAENPSTLTPKRWISRARIVKTADHNFFTRDTRLRARLGQAIARLSAPEHSLLKHWAKHHLPGAPAE